MAEDLLKVEGLKQYYPASSGLFGKKTYVKAVDDVDFEVKKGEVFGIVGESGCGKSTMGRAILRLHEPTSGKVYFEGKDILGYNKKQLKDLRKDMQIIFQDPFASLNPRMTVSEAIIEPLLVQGIYKPNEKAAITQQVEKIMNLVGLAKRLVNTYPHELDGGRRQRIGIARALAVQPKLIIADEPVSALDVSIQAQVLNLLNQLKHEFNLTYIFVAHDLSVVEHISDRVGVMYLGNFVEVGDKKSLYGNPLHPYTKALLSAVPVPDPTAKKDRVILEGSIPSALNPPTGCKFHTRCPNCMECCVTDVPKRYQVSENHYVYCHLYDDKTNG